MGTGGMPVFAGALVTAADGRILCQLRDDKPGIMAPGVWSCSPGGRVEVGESPDKAIVRELWEEFRVEVAGLKEMFIHNEPSGLNRGEYHCFAANLVTPLDEVECHEGVKAQFFPLRDALTLPQHPVSRRFVRAYLDLIES